MFYTRDETLYNGDLLSGENRLRHTHTEYYNYCNWYNNEHNYASLEGIYESALPHSYTEINAYSLVSTHKMKDQFWGDAYEIRAHG